MSKRRTFQWRVRHLLGGWCQRLAWHLLDPHDNWMMDYYNDKGHACCRSIRGFFSVANAQAKRCKGKIVGWNAKTIHPEGEEWKS